MKKRRSVIISLLLVAALTLGIGYAALARDLQINGSANLQGNNEDFDIVFVSGNSNPVDVATVTVTDGSPTASYTITGLSEKGDSVTLTFVAENKTADIDAVLKSITSTTGELVITTETGDVTGTYSDYFSKTMTITNTDGQTFGQVDEDDPDAVPADFVVGPGEQVTVTITVTLEKSVTDPVSATSFIALHFSGVN